MGKKNSVEDEPSDDDSVQEVLPSESRASRALNSVYLDKDEFLKSVLDSSFDMETIGLAKPDAELKEGRTLSSHNRDNPFAPLNYKPPSGEDNFFDSMPDEAERTDISKSIQTILDSSTPKRKPSSEKIPNPTSTKILLEEVLSEEDTKPKESLSELDNPNKMPPWVIGSDTLKAIKYAGDEQLILHYEILEFSRFLSPTITESSIRDKVTSSIQNIIKALWPACRTEVFGSYATGLYLPSSDIDLCVMHTPGEGSEKELDDLARAVRGVPGFARKVHVIKNTRVPLVKLVAREGDVRCDISFGQTNGVKNVPVILSYLDEYPALRPLLLVIKCFLQQRSLNEVYSGGLGSYAVLLLVVSHLQTLQFNSPSISLNLGAVLTEFFNMYGRRFNMAVAGIAVKDDGTYYNKVERYDTTPGETLRFSIEDPNDLTNEIGINSFAGSRVRKAFGHAHFQLCKWRRSNPLHPVTPLSRLIDPHEKTFIARRPVVVEDLQKQGLVDLADYTRRKLIERNKRENAKSKDHPSPTQNYAKFVNGGVGPRVSGHRDTKRRRTSPNASHPHNRLTFAARFVGPDDGEFEVPPRERSLSANLQARLGTNVKHRNSRKRQHGRR